MISHRIKKEHALEQLARDIYRVALRKAKSNPEDERGWEGELIFFGSSYDIRGQMINYRLNGENYGAAYINETRRISKRSCYVSCTFVPEPAFRQSFDRGIIPEAEFLREENGQGNLRWHSEVMAGKLNPKKTERVLGNIREVSSKAGALRVN